MLQTLGLSCLHGEIFSDGSVAEVQIPCDNFLSVNIIKHEPCSHFIKEIILYKEGQLTHFKQRQWRYFLFFRAGLNNGGFPMVEALL